MRFGIVGFNWRISELEFAQIGDPKVSELAREGHPN